MISVLELLHDREGKFKLRFISP